VRSRARHRLTLADLPPKVRDYVRTLIEQTPPTPLRAVSADELRREMLKAEREKLVATFCQQLGAVGLLPFFEREHVFHVKRKWRLDLYAPIARVGIELHGGINETKARGRHLRAGGFERDREKMNAAAEAGITVYEYTTRMIASGAALEQMQRVLR
jgi:hypothetical protein